MLDVHSLHALKDNYIYMLVNAHGEAAAVDPGDAEPVEQFLTDHAFRLTHILCTHHHWDHVGGIPDLVRRHSVQVVGSVYDAARIAHCTQGVSETKPLQLWDREVRILELPGHTLGQIAYWLVEEKALFVGDTLFSAGCGRLFEGTAEQMFSSLQKIKQLPADTRIYFGHEYTLRNLEFVLQREPAAAVQNYLEEARRKLAATGTTTPARLGAEVQINPFLRASTVGEFTSWREARNHW